MISTAFVPFVRFTDVYVALSPEFARLALIVYFPAFFATSLRVNTTPARVLSSAVIVSVLEPSLKFVISIVFPPTTIVHFPLVYVAGLIETLFVSYSFEKVSPSVNERASDDAFLISNQSVLCGSVNL